MSSAKSDESSCHSEAEPESVADVRRVVEDDAVGLAVGRLASGRRRRSRCAVLLLRVGREHGAGVALAADLLPRPVDLDRGRPRAREPPLVTRAACAGVSGQQPEAAARRARRRGPASPVRPSDSHADRALEHGVLGRAVLREAEASRVAASAWPFCGVDPHVARGAVAVAARPVLEADVDLRRRQAPRRPPRAAPARRVERQRFAACPRASNVTMLCSPEYCRSTRLRRSGAAAPDAARGREDAAHVARRRGPLGWCGRPSAASLDSTMLSAAIPVARAATSPSTDSSSRTPASRR